MSHIIDRNMSARCMIIQRLHYLDVILFSIMHYLLYEASVLFVTQVTVLFILVE